MQDSKVVTEYWRHAAKFESLTNFTPSQACKSWKIISEQECSQGKIDNPEICAALLESGSLVVIAPYYAKKFDEFFVPVLLLAELDATGAFVSKPINAWPIIPKSAVDSSESSEVCLGSDQSFDNYFILQPPEWIDEPLDLTWANQLAYARDMLQQVTNGVWQTHLQQQKYCLANDGLIFPLSVIHNDLPVEAKILSNRVKLELIEVERNSGKSAHAKKIVLDAWIEAAVKQASPPGYVWLGYKQELKFCNILNYFEQDSKIADFISSQDSSVDVHADLSQNFTAYIRGRQVLRNWEDLQERLHNKYADKGGIYKRIEQLQTVIKEAQVRQKHIQVLHSIWVRQLELVPTWSKVLDFIPSMQPRRLQRLHAFFKQNFPSEQVHDFNQEQLDSLMQEKIRRSENTLRFIGDTLHQTETDLHQQELVKEKCIQWARGYNPDIQDMCSVLDLANDMIWNKVVALTICYWQRFFKQNPEYADFSNRDVSEIELLIVEHAEYISPIQAAHMIAISKKSIIMGTYNSICNPRFSPHIDYDIARVFKLVTCDADFEDLQFSGVLASMGNMWSLTANGKEADKILSSRNEIQLQYNFVQINDGSAEYLGSRINIFEANAIKHWLVSSAPIDTDVAIYTTFSGQVQYLRSQLHDSKFAGVPIYLIQEPCFAKSAYSLFSPVYTASDSGPYCFDRGVEILQNMTANTTQQIIVFGDKAIFNPALHSASGNFAKLFNPEIQETTKNIILEKEVDCV